MTGVKGLGCVEREIKSRQKPQSLKQEILLRVPLVFTGPPLCGREEGDRCCFTLDLYFLKLILVAHTSREILASENVTILLCLVTL